MNIQPVKLNHLGFTCRCCHCGKTIGGRFNEKEPRFADLDGKPFEAYYCETCKGEIEKHEKNINSTG